MMRISCVVLVSLMFEALNAQSILGQGGSESGGAALFDINLGLSAWTLVVFLGLLFILGKYAWGPILSAVEAREEGIKSALEAASEKNSEAARLLEEHREQLADARRQSSELIAEARTAGDQVRQEIEEKARSDAHAILERARSEIEKEKNTAVEILRKESVHLALAAASRLMEENLDQEQDRALVERYLSDLGSGRGGR